MIKIAIIIWIEPYKDLIEYTFGKKLVTKIALLNLGLVKFIFPLCVSCTDGLL